MFVTLSASCSGSSPVCDCRLYLLRVRCCIITTSTSGSTVIQPPISCLYYIRSCIHLTQDDFHKKNVSKLFIIIDCAVTGILKLVSSWFFTAFIFVSIHCSHSCLAKNIENSSFAVHLYGKPLLREYETFSSQLQTHITYNTAVHVGTAHAEAIF